MCHYVGFSNIGFLISKISRFHSSLYEIAVCNSQYVESVVDASWKMFHQRVKLAQASDFQQTACHWLLAVVLETGYVEPCHIKYLSLLMVLVISTLQMYRVITLLEKNLQARAMLHLSGTMHSQLFLISYTELTVLCSYISTIAVNHATTLHEPIVMYRSQFV